mgnify:CR=1 FL=1
MFSVRLYIRILLQVVAIVLVTGLGVAGIVTGRAVILGFVALFIAAWLISLLVYYLNASNRRIQLFLDAIEDDESMLYFPEDIGSREQRRLHAAFNRIHMLMTENKRKAFDRELHRKEYESWDKLMHVLTHEIMNSIAPVVSLSGTLLSYFRTKDAPKSSGEITDIKSQGQTLMHFTESYRQFAYLKQPEPKPFPLTYLLQNLQTLYLPDMQRLHIGFSLVLFQPEITVHADEKLLSQVLINLLKNAMQALEGQADGKIRMEVGAEKNQLLIRVTDNGPGVPSDLMEDIFVPFFTTKATGSGIGLSLSRQIIRMHGGELSVASQPYRETCFTVSLPIKS